jgi:cell pole-organizing protein PopZ
MRNAGEPTVEEILESIKKVIARDNRAGATEQRRQRETNGVVEPDFTPTGGEEQEDVLDLSEEAQFTGAGEEYGMAEYHDGDDDEDAVGTPEAPLVTENVRVSMQESLAALAMLAEPGAPPQIVRSGETSLEGLTRDLLRPALAEWLDKNLPAMVERMVASEIARIVGKKG